MPNSYCAEQTLQTTTLSMHAEIKWICGLGKNYARLCVVSEDSEFINHVYIVSECQLVAQLLWTP